MAIASLLSSSGLILALAVFVLSSAKLRSLPAYLLGIYLVAHAEVVMIVQLAGLAQALGKPLVLLLQVLFASASILLWVRSGRPRLLPRPNELNLAGQTGNWRSILGLLLLGILVVLVGYVYLRKALVILATPQTNYDALTYHLSRVGYWLQYNSMYPWPTPNLRQTTFPMNGELAVLWTILWWGTDRLAGFVQWVAVPASMIGIYGLVRLLGYSRWQGAVTGLLWGTLTQVLSQSSTTQNDLLTASFWVAAVYFLFAGLRERKASPLVLSGLGVGLAVGTKFTSMMVFPGLAVAMVVLMLLRWQEPAFRRSFLRWMAACLLGLALWGSYTYAQNAMAFGNPLGPNARRSAAGAMQVKRGDSRYSERLRDNLGRYTYQFVDFSGLPFRLASRVNPAKISVFSYLFERLGIAFDNPRTASRVGFSLETINAFDENSSWYGPLSIFLILAMALQTYEGVRGRDAMRATLVITGAGFLLAESALQVWTPVKGRYFMVPVALCFPLMAGLLQLRTVGRAALACAVIVLGITVMFRVARSTGVFRIGPGDAFSSTRQDPPWENEFTYRLIARTVPANASIGLESSDDFRDYPFFGERFTRFVTLAMPENERMLPRTELERYAADFRNSDYLFLTRGGSPTSRQHALRQFILLSDDGANSLWVRSDLRSSHECDGERWPFTDFLQSSSVAVCPRFPILPGLTAGGDARTIYLRDGHFVPTISPVSQGALGFDLLVKEAVEVQFSIDLVPRDPRRAQTLELTITSPGSKPQVQSATFSRMSAVTLKVPLRAGAYGILLRLAEGSTEASITKIQVTVP